MNAPVIEARGRCRRRGKGGFSMKKSVDGTLGTYDQKAARREPGGLA